MLDVGGLGELIHAVNTVVTHSRLLPIPSCRQANLHALSFFAHRIVTRSLAHHEYVNTDVFGSSAFPAAAKPDIQTFQTDDGQVPLLRKQQLHEQAHIIHTHAFQN